MLLHYLVYFLSKKISVSFSTSINTLPGAPTIELRKKMFYFFLLGTRTTFCRKYIKYVSMLH